MIKILHIISGLNRGGSETLLLDFIKNSSRNFEHVVWYYETNEICEMVPDYKKFGIEVINLTTFKVWFKFRDLPETIQKIKEINPQLVHLHNQYFWKFSYALAAKLAGKKVITTLHYIPKNFRFPKPLLLFVFEYFLNFLVEKQVAISSEVQKIQNKRFKTNYKLLQIISNGVDFEKLKITRSKQETLTELNLSEQNLIVGTVGNTRWEKGTDLLVEAIDFLKNDFQNLKVVIVGEVRNDNFTQNALQKIKKLKLENFFIFTGKKTDVANFVNCFEIFVLPSRSEGFGLALVEAMFLEKPCVAFKTGGISDIVRNENLGFLAEPENSKDFAKQLKKMLLLSQTEKIEIGKNAKKFVVENFSIQTFTKQYEELYLKICKK